MSNRVHTQVQAQQKTLTELLSNSRLLQYTCACGGLPGIDGLCTECRDKRLTLPSSRRGFEAPSASAVAQGNSYAQDNVTSSSVVVDRASHFGHDFSRIPVYSSRPSVIQTKLAVNQPGDVYEQEADQIAEQVMRMTDLEPPVSDDQDEAKNSVMRKQSSQTENHAVTDTHSVPSIVHDVLNGGGGQPLDATTRAFMEPRFGHDFSQVRVHTDERAIESAQSVNALAYTVDRDVVFGQGLYDPETSEGRRLLAHELTHVVQQRPSKASELGANIAYPRQAEWGGEWNAQTEGPLPITRSLPALMCAPQPQGHQQKEEGGKSPKEQKTLKEEGYSASEPVNYTETAQIIDKVLQRNQRLAPYIGDKLKLGFRINNKAKFVIELSDSNFDSAYWKTYPEEQGRKVYAIGFYDDKKDVVHLRPNAKFGAALHEAVHRLAHPRLYRSLYVAGVVSEDLQEVLKEGITAYFTDSILNDEKLPEWNDYPREKEKARKLVRILGSDGFDLVAKYNFKGDLLSLKEIGKKLGLSEEEYQREGPTAVFKLMKKRL